MGRKRSLSRSISPTNQPSRKERKETKESKQSNDGKKNMDIINELALSTPSIGDIINKWKGNYEESSLWSELVKEMEKEKENISSSSIRAVYSEVLDRYPYCYGYWCKWAAYEGTKSSNRTIEVFEKGLSVFPLSVDIWMAYLRYMRNELSNRSNGIEGIQRLNARALVTVGKEWKSGPVWKYVLEFEKSLNNNQALTILLDNVLSIPIEMIGELWNNVEEHFENTEWKDLLNKDERIEIEKMLDKKIDDKNERIKELKSLALEKRRKIYEKTAHKMAQMSVYEKKIKRNYFHWKPLEKSQLTNWKEYLEWVKSQEDETDLIILTFERAIIPCALYEELWIMYAHWRESRKEFVESESILERAHYIHCPKSPMITLLYSSTIEAKKSPKEALSILRSFNMVVPGNLMIINRYLATLKRQLKQSGEKEIIRVYENLIKYGDISPSEDNFEPSREIVSYYSMHFARYLAKVLKDHTTAEEVIRAAIKKDFDNEQLYLQLISIAMDQKTMNEFDVCEAFDVCIRNVKVDYALRLKFSQRKLNFLEEYSADIRKIRSHTIFHKSLISKVSLK